VLKLPEVPSVLVETAYISNGKEEKLLGSDRFQMRIAEGMARSVAEFLPPLPATAAASVSGSEGDHKPRDPSVGVVKGKAKPVADKKRDPISKSGAKTAYRVKRGDTLGAIATRYGTTIRVLVDLNHLKRPDPLYVGRKLVLPESPFPSKEVGTR
jgi:N-acetylmuramoyl-L-alanine amidase